MARVRSLLLGLLLVVLCFSAVVSAAKEGAPRPAPAPTSGTDISSAGSAQGPTAWISTNTTCPWPALGTPDVFLDVPRLEVDGLELQVENLDVKVSVTASLAHLLTIHVGVEAKVQKVNLSIKAVRAALRLEARLDTIAAMINRTLSSVEANPALLTSLVSSTAATLDKALLASFSTAQGT
jgi:hypothetical protein